VYAKAPSAWRRGDEAVFSNSSRIKAEGFSKLNIYPKWWQDLMNPISEHSEKKAKKQKTQARGPTPKVNDFKISNLTLAQTCDKGVETDFEGENSIRKTEKGRNEGFAIKTEGNSGRGREKKVDDVEVGKSLQFVNLFNRDNSDSSNSTGSFFPTVEMKRFYQMEFRRLFKDSFTKQ
jgi:hypothetical protein